MALKKENGLNVDLKSRGGAKSFPILLVNPAMGGKEYSWEDRLRNYLSLGTLASALGDNFFLKKFAALSGRKDTIPGKDEPLFEVHLLDLSLKPPGESVQDCLQTFLREKGINPLLLGTTATSGQWVEAREVAEAARRLIPNALRVIGGPHVTVLPEEFMRSSEFEVACIGEGVETLTDLILALIDSGREKIEQVSGIAFKEERGRVRMTPPRKFLMSLDEYPFPSKSLDLFFEDGQDSEKNSYSLIHILAGFGCPHHCIFCAQQAIHRGGIRERSADSIFEEIKELQALGFRRFALVQETFLRNKARAERFCRLLEDSDLGAEWTIEARVDQVDFELLFRMKKAGLRFIQIGVESGDQELLDSLGKGIQIKDVIRVRDWCEELQIDTAFYFLVGLPGQNWQSIYRSALFLKNHPPYNRISMHVSTAVAVPYPGTKMAEEGTVRLVGVDPQNHNWPTRNPQVEVDEEGRYLGQNYTETDAMTAEEILEAYTYLDDFGQFLLHGKYHSDLAHQERNKTQDFARRNFHMIQRRTIRDLVIRAQPGLTAEAYRQNRRTILEKDSGQESRFKDLNPYWEDSSETFLQSLAFLRFANGFHSLKCLSVPNRIKWMKVCSLLWGMIGEGFLSLSFASEGEEEGMELNRRLEAIPTNCLDEYLELLDRGIKIKSIGPEGLLEGERVTAFGISFYLDLQKRKIIVDKIPPDISPSPSAQL